MTHPELFCPPTGATQVANGSAQLGGSVEPGQSVGIPETRRGRRAVHTDAAARKRAHRANVARLDLTTKPEIAQTIGDIAESLGCSRNDVMNSLVRFALTNRNWKQVGLYGARAAVGAAL